MNIALVLDPRFPGGTSSAVAQEVPILARDHDVTVYALETRHFKGRECNPRLAKALEAEGIDLIWAPKVVSAEIVVFHNPAALKFDTQLDLRVVADQVYVVSHENFLRPVGAPGFDANMAMGLIDQAVVANHRLIAPVSAYNRANAAKWLESEHCKLSGWALAPYDWFNICNFDLAEPTSNPRDRRGRMSRAGFEQFPSRKVMEQHFPAHAEKCLILGGNSLLDDPDDIPNHWEVHRFGAMGVSAFFQEVDFFIYFTNPCLRESFGRVIAEAIAAGKVVITDPGTGSTFGPSVVTTEGDDIDAIVAGFVAEPSRYQDFVTQAQTWLQRFSGDAFAADISKQFKEIGQRPGALL